MLVINELTVAVNDGFSYLLSWDINPTSETISGYSIDIYRCEGPSSDISEYDLVASGISANSYIYTETSVSGLLNLHRNWYYKIEVINNSTLTSKIYMDEPSYVRQTTTDNIHREIIRRKNLSLSRTHYSRRNFRLIKRRTWGVHCSVCWDEALMRASLGNCEVCKGTGWINGYYDPLIFYGMVNPSPKYNQINMFGEWMPSDVMLNVLNFPPITIKDLVVDDNRNIWVVRQVRTVERLGFIMEQSVQLSLVDPHDIVYRIF